MLSTHYRAILLSHPASYFDERSMEDGCRRTPGSSDGRCPDKRTLVDANIGSDIVVVTGAVSRGTGGVAQRDHAVKVCKPVRLGIQRTTRSARPTCRPTRQIRLWAY